MYHATKLNEYYTLILTPNMKKNNWLLLPTFVNWAIVDDMRRFFRNYSEFLQE